MKVLTRMIALSAMLALTAMPLRAQKWEHLADTPQMGWSTWNKFQGNISEDIIKGIADAMAETGLRDAGYTYINIDDCWHGKRDGNGFIQADLVKFPNGLKALADYLHGKGLKLGIYSDAGTGTCAGMPGSLGHEYQDALQYARWEVDYLKYDWCNTTNINPQGAYQLISDALRSAGRPIFLSMCEWGNSRPWKWAREVGHSWRTTPDIWCNFDSLKVFEAGYTQFGVMQCIQFNDSLRQYAGPGHWNDPDMLEVGNGMTENEDRAHFTMWCMMASPLILGNDLRNMSEATRNIIMNKEIIAIDQDPLGVQGWHYCDKAGLQFWFKPLAGDDWAFTILNPTKEDIAYELNWQDFNLTDDVVSKRSTQFDTIVYQVYNLWTHKVEGKTSQKNKTERKLIVKSRDVVSYRLTPNKK
ncbi:MAG: glycoside hydrolase family 27 protein [Prevotella sp.]|nr:glycoside hydrolase family 27 protein [Prevotella sp.]